MFSEQERFMRTEITFTLRKNGGYRTNGLGGRSFPVVRQADENLRRCFRKFSYNSPSNLHC